eukprot:m.244227 g.244227  ORF g.244227 m.244227 type:complete len:145 (+) comp30204_c0_seq1:31-465(+)
MAAHQGSAWNAAGTFEERDTSKWMKQQLDTKLVGLRREVEGVTVETTRVGRCEGESRVLIVRGKKRAGFEYSLDLHWRSSGAVSGSGVLTITEISETSLDDFESEVQIDAPHGSSSKLRIAATGLQGDIRKVFEAAVQQMLAEW